MRRSFSIAVYCFLVALQIDAQENSIEFRSLSEWPELSSGLLNPGGIAAAFYAGTDKNVAYFRFGSKPLPISRLKWDLALQTPYSEKNDPALLGDFDGLTQSTNFQLNLSGLFVNAAMPPILNLEIVRLCATYAGMPENGADQCTIREVRDYFLRNSDANCQNMSDSQCEASANDRAALFLQELRNIESSLVRERRIPPVSAVTFGAKVKYGVRQFSFRDPDTLASQEQQESPWSASAYAFYVFGQNSIGGGIELQHSYKEQQQVQICTDLPMHIGVSTCSNGRIGAPVQRQRRLAFLEMHHNQRQRQFAISPRISYDIEKGETGLNVPVYLIRNQDGLLTGGIQVGWQSESNEMSVGFFVGQAFSYY